MKRRNHGPDALGVLRTAAALAGGLCMLGAQAQGQLTFGGNLDIGTRIDKNKTSVKLVSSNSLLPSRLTFGALEELGDGWRAQAVLEAGLTVDDGAGAVQPPGAPAGSFTFGRFSNIAIGSERTGYLSLGRQYTPLFVMGASGVADVFGGAALGGATSISSFTVRASNSVAYTYGYGPRTLLKASPAQGLGVAVLLAPGESATAGGAGNQGGFNVSYGDGAWWAGYGFHWIRGTSQAISTAVPDSTTPVLRQQTLAVAYNFGSLRMNAGFNRGRNSLNSNAGINRSGTYVGLSYALTSNQELKAFYGRMNDRRALNADYSTVQFAYTYAFSKQTSIYALAGQVDNSLSAAATLLNTSSAVQTAAGLNSRSMALGILQRF